MPFSQIPGNLSVWFPGKPLPPGPHFPSSFFATAPNWGKSTPGHLKTTTVKPTRFTLSTSTTKLTTITIPGFDENGETTTEGPSSDVYDVEMNWDDATWILIMSIFIFMMQTGFGLLESGIVHVKNEANILMKNIVDVVLGGFTYWIFGFSLSYGMSPGSNGFVGVGEYVVDSKYYDLMGPVMITFLFQLSFATTATTIVSGTVAERCNFKAYCLFSLFNTIVYSIPARWVWGSTGWLSEMGCIDIAGSGAVHLLGGASGYVAAWMVGPRTGRYDNGPDPLPVQNPVNCILGLFSLWWGWLAFNSGSTFGVTGDKWKFAARAASATMVASFGGGLVGAIYTLAKPDGIFDVMDVVNPVLGALVGVTAGCAIFHMFDALVVGIIGGIVTIATAGFADWTRVDDPVGATAVHGFGGIWGMLAVGFFADDDGGAGFIKGSLGLFRGGNFYLLGIQTLASVCITAWAIVTTTILFFLIGIIVPLRLTAYEELLGADITEHLVRRKCAGTTPALSALRRIPEVRVIEEKAGIVGYTNATHDAILWTMEELKNSRRLSTLRRNATAVTTAVLTNPTKLNRITVDSCGPGNVIGNGYQMEVFQEWDESELREVKVATKTPEYTPKPEQDKLNRNPTLTLSPLPLPQPERPSSPILPPKSPSDNQQLSVLLQRFALLTKLFSKRF